METPTMSHGHDINTHVIHSLGDFVDVTQEPFVPVMLSLSAIEKTCIESA